MEVVLKNKDNFINIEDVKEYQFLKINSLKIYKGDFADIHLYIYVKYEALAKGSNTYAGHADKKPIEKIPYVLDFKETLKDYYKVAALLEFNFDVKSNSEFIGVLDFDLLNEL